MVRVLKEFLRMGSPAAVVGSGKGFREIRDVPGEPILHRQEIRRDAAVVVNEVLDAKLYPVLGAEDEPELFRHRGPGDGGEHVRVATKLNRIIRLGRAGQLCVPHLIASGFIEQKKVRISGEWLMFQKRLIDNGDL